MLDDRLEDLCHERRLHLKYAGPLGNPWQAGIGPTVWECARWRVTCFHDKGTGELVSPRYDEGWFRARLEKRELEERVLFHMIAGRFEPGIGGVRGPFREDVIPIKLGPYHFREGTLGPYHFDILVERHRDAPPIDEPVAELGMSIRRFLKQVEGERE